LMQRSSLAWAIGDGLVSSAEAELTGAPCRL
jgi:hypothetical protein